MGKTEIGKDGHVHTIRLDDLIVHKYSGRDALLAKASKIARTFIESELRDGEAVQSPRPGTFLIHLPMLTPEAGALRCAVLADQIYKEIKRLNPTAVALSDDDPTGDDDETGERVPRSARASGPSLPASKSLRETGNRAFARMGESQRPSGELSEAELRALANVKLAFHPVWHTRNKLITAYLCVPTLDGASVTGAQILDSSHPGLGDLLTAKLDAVVYEQTARALSTLLRERLKAVLIAPIHFSTVDRLQHMDKLLAAAGSGIPDDAKNLLVFEILDLPENATRFRLREPVAYLRTRARALIARLNFESPHQSTLKELGFHGVSIDAAAYRWEEGRFFKAFEDFAIETEKHGLQSFVHGLATTSLTVAAVAAGFTYMDGAAVAAPVMSPSHLKPFEIDMLYSD